MANKDILIAAIDKFITDYGMLPYGGVPPISAILNGYGEQAGIKETMPDGITFTTQDIKDTSEYLSELYVGHYPYEMWYEQLGSNLTISDTVIPPPTTTETFSTKTMLIIGGALLLIFMLKNNR